MGMEKERSRRLVWGRRGGGGGCVWGGRGGGCVQYNN
jgi:hypothetical protein